MLTSNVVVDRIIDILNCIKKVINVKKKNYELWIFLLTAVVGGSFGAYAIIRYGMFASAQTMNLLNLMLSIFGTNLPEFLFRLVIALFYAFGVALGVLIPRYTKIDVRLVSIIVSAIATIIVALTPVDYIGLYVSGPIFFSMALQWGAFPGANGRNAASVFMTNNFRQTIIGTTNYICTKEKEHLKYASFHGSIVAFYILGCGLTYFLTRFFGFHAIIYVLVPLFLIFILLGKEKAERGAEYED